MKKFEKGQRVVYCPADARMGDGTFDIDFAKTGWVHCVEDNIVFVKLSLDLHNGGWMGAPSQAYDPEDLELVKGGGSRLFSPDVLELAEGLETMTPAARKILAATIEIMAKNPDLTRSPRPRSGLAGRTGRGRRRSAGPVHRGPIPRRRQGRSDPMWGRAYNRSSRTAARAGNLFALWKAAAL